MNKKNVLLLLGLGILTVFFIYQYRDRFPIEKSDQQSVSQEKGRETSALQNNDELVQKNVISNSSPPSPSQNSMDAATNPNDQIKIRNPSSTPPAPPTEGGLTSLEYLQKYLRDPARVPEEREFAQSDTKFRTLPGVVAIKKRELPSNMGSAVVREFFDFVIVRGQPSEQNPEKAFPVVYDVNRGTLALVTGSIKVFFENEMESSALGSRFNMELVQEFSDIRVASFRTQNKKVNGLIEVVEALKREPGIKTASLVLIESVATPK